MASKTKICPECKKNKNIDEFVNSMGVKAPRGRYCESCHKKRKEAQEIKYRLESLERWQAGEKDIIEKYKFLYEDDWKSRVPPSLVRLRLFMERDFCLYCGKSFKKHQQQPDSYEISENYHIEKAITDAAKAAYLATIIKHSMEKIEKFINALEVKDWNIEQPFNTRLNKLKKSNPEAFFYWYKIYKIDKEKIK
jgi:hypothetical protein